MRQLIPRCEFLADDNGGVFDLEGNKIEPKEVQIGYRSEGPDAWASSFRVEGSVWKWQEGEGWTYWHDGISGWGYEGMDFVAVTYTETGYEVKHYVGAEY